MGRSLSSRRRPTKVVRGAVVFVATLAILWLGSAVGLALSIPVTNAAGTQVGTIDVGVTPNGKGIVGGFTSTTGEPPSLQAAAAACGEDHFNWLQIVIADSAPPLGADGKPLTPPYLDPPSGGYYNQWGDKIPWYWDEGHDPPPGTPHWEDGYHLNDNLRDPNGDGVNETLRFVDYPYSPPPVHVEFVTFLVSCNADGSLHSFHGGFSWEYNNPPKAGEEEGEGSDRANREIFDWPWNTGQSNLYGPLDPSYADAWYQWITPRPGDANGDHAVNDVDAAILAANWQRPFPGIGWEQGDFNGDGIVNWTDASMMGANWLYVAPPPPPPPPPGSVPEPTSVVMFFGLVLSLAVIRWRRCR
jgi:hypothetical protein